LSGAEARRPIVRWQPERLEKECADRDDVVVVDVRTADSRALHPYEIPGARWMPLPAVVDQAGSLPRDAPIVTYCT